LKHIVRKLGRFWLLSRKHVYHRLGISHERDRCRVLVAGMQRSGTNMLMNVLEECLETDVYHERDTRAFSNYRMRSPREIGVLIGRSPARVFVIKALCELQDLALLMDEFSPAKTIWIVRDYNDVVNSMMRSFGNMAKQVLRIVDDGDPSGWIGRGMSDETRAILKTLVTDELDDATASALQWYLRNILFFEQGFDADERVMLVSYETLVSQPVEEFGRVFAFAGIEYSPRVARKVSPRSVGKNPPPDIAPEVRELCDGLFRRFRNLLDDRK
jgi:hypothetical protein